MSNNPSGRHGQSVRRGVAPLLLMAALHSAAFAQEEQQKPLTDEQRVESMVILNQNGVMSVAYIRPWWFEIGDYATSLGKVLVREIHAAQDACQVNLTAMQDDDSALLDDDYLALINSLAVDGEIAYGHLVTSLLQKYASEKWVDPESAADVGKLKPLKGAYCFDESAESPGILRQMFQEPENPKAIGGRLWSQRMCGELYILKRCLTDLAIIHLLRKRAGVEDGNRIEPDADGRLGRISPRMVIGNSDMLIEKPPVSSSK